MDSKKPERKPRKAAPTPAAEKLPRPKQTAQGINRGGRPQQWTPQLERALSLHMLGRSDRKIAEDLEINEKTIGGWRRRPDWLERVEARMRVDASWYDEERRRAARQATAEAYETLASPDLTLDQRIRLIEMLGKWGGMEIKRVESITKIDLSGRSREEIEAELARLRG